MADAAQPSVGPSARPGLPTGHPLAPGTAREDTGRVGRPGTGSCRGCGAPFPVAGTGPPREWCGQPCRRRTRRAEARDAERLAEAARRAALIEAAGPIFAWPGDR